MEVFQGRQNRRQNFLLINFKTEGGDMGDRRREG